MDIKLLKQARTKESRLGHFYLRIIRDMERENKPKSAINIVRKLVRHKVSTIVDIDIAIYLASKNRRLKK
jgi:hypothetical protein